jgi:hypothetical protein
MKRDLRDGEARMGARPLAGTCRIDQVLMNRTSTNEPQRSPFRRIDAA